MVVLIVIDDGCSGGVAGHAQSRRAAMSASFSTQVAPSTYPALDVAWHFSCALAYAVSWHSLNPGLSQHHQAICDDPSAFIE